jgi:hypothetical protein
MSKARNTADEWETPEGQVADGSTGGPEPDSTPEGAAPDGNENTGGDPEGAAPGENKNTGGGPGGPDPVNGQEFAAIEDHAKREKTPASVFAAVLTTQGWAAGKKVTRTDFKKAVDAFLNAPMGGVKSPKEEDSNVTGNNK